VKWKDKAVFKEPDERELVGEGARGKKGRQGGH